jgi:hypothetical protein
VIPGFVIAWVTFPGVIVHELAHALFCRLFGVAIYEVKYFNFSTDFGQPAGYVIHAPPEKNWQNVLIGVGPFFINTILGGIIGAPGAIPVIKFGGLNPLDLLMVWLGVSIAMHAFPSTGDAASIWRSATGAGASFWSKVVATPIVGIIYLGSLASILWLDALYGIAVVCALPYLAVHLLA